MKLEKFYSGKLVFITGGSEGIGRSIALELVSLGARVIITSRSTEKLAAVVKDSGGKIHSRAFDLTDFTATETALKTLVDVFGIPDYLINCAGYARPGYIEDLSLEHYQRMMNLNYFGQVHAIKALLPFFIKKKMGTIVNVSSIAGFIGLFGYTGYCASKYAVIGFSEALRRELAIYNIRVSVLCPPNTRTPGLDEENKYKPPEVLATEEKIKVQDPIEVTRSFLKQLPRNPFIITTTLDGKWTYRLSRWLPFLINLFVKRPIN